MLTLTYEYKLIPTQQQVLDIEKILTVCRKVWNFALRERKDWVNSRKCRVDACSIDGEYIIPADVPFPNYHKQAKNLTEAKKIIPELQLVNAQVLQQVLRNLDRAWDDIWKRGFGFPRFKKHFRMRSFVFPQLKGEVVKANRVKLPQLGWVKFRVSRPIPDGFKVKQARVVRRASGYFVMLSLQLDVNVPEVSFHGHPLGIDIGLESFLATSVGELVARPKFFNSLHRKLELLQRRLKHKKLGSNNRRKLNSKIARLHQQISDTRKNFHWKLAHHLCDQAGSIFVEDIDFRAWAKGMFGKHTLDASFGQFFNILSYVCWKRGVFFAKVSKDYTSQICPECGALTGKKELDLREHNCPECGYKTHRDVAAAQVIRNRGVSAVLALCGEEQLT
ncbi:transposase [cyanobacterium TDX16]|nr:transposase [cyanobacterium TDX16]